MFQLGFQVSCQFPSEGEPGYVGLDLGRSHLGIGADPDGNRVIIASRS
jgi:hypothetical protein